MAHSESRRARIDDALASVMAMGPGSGGRRGGRSRRRSRGSGKRPGRRPLWLIVLRWVGPPLLFALLPFVVLLRGATYLYSATALPTWACVALSAAGAGLALFLSTAWVARRLGASLPRFGMRLSIIIAVAYCAFALVYVSADNVKHVDIRATYTALHPLLRLSVSTLVLIDSNSMITDAQRSPEDYDAMGLARNAGSLHFVQSDGYAHAVDLRTIGRPEWANRLTKSYFALLGFQVLRHTGTADHLHVSLRMR